MVQVSANKPELEPAPVADAAPAPRGQEPSRQLTPMMRQYLEVKGQHPDAILFFRLGRLLRDVLRGRRSRASEILQITLTSRAKGDERGPDVRRALPRRQGLHRQAGRGRPQGRHLRPDGGAGQGHGHRPARGDPGRHPGHGPRRGAARRPREQLPGRGRARRRAGGGAGAARRLHRRVPRRRARRPTRALVDEVAPRRRRARCCVPQGAAPTGARRRSRAPARGASRRRASRTRPSSRRAPQAFLKRHFGTPRARGLRPRRAAAGGRRGGRGAALPEGDPARRAPSTSTASRCHRAAPTMVLDEATRANLELVRTLRDGKRKGSLLGLLDKSATAMGGRRLARWLSYPLLDLAAIDRAPRRGGRAGRERGAARGAGRATCAEIADLERLTARLSLGQGNARDLRALASSLLALPGARRAGSAAARAALLRELGRAARPRSAELAALLDRAVALEPPVGAQGGRAHPRGLRRRARRARGHRHRGQGLPARARGQGARAHRDRLAQGPLQPGLRLLHRGHQGRTCTWCPPDYVRKQTTAGGERFVTEELKEFEEQVLTAEERRIALELAALRGAARRGGRPQAPRLRGAAEAVAVADALLSLARAAAEHGYVRPEVDDSRRPRHRRGPPPGGRADARAARPSSPTTCALDRTSQQLLVITGPNMAGKTTVMRQVALIVLMAQAGAFVPARRARVGLCDRIFTRVGASDNLSRGQSTFMVEMTETANILHNATARSLVILDEIGRGTSTFDGLSIAWAVAEHLHDQVGRAHALRHALPRADRPRAARSRG